MTFLGLSKTGGRGLMPAEECQGSGLATDYSERVASLVLLNVTDHPQMHSIKVVLLFRR